MEGIPAQTRDALTAAHEGINRHLTEGIIPFWLTRGNDPEFGGYLTCFDDAGNPTDDTDKYIVTQTRMIWGFSAMLEAGVDAETSAALRSGAEQGVRFFINKFWDTRHGGWFWRVARDGSLLDGGKVTYGQVFAAYALSQYGLSTGDPLGLEYASKTFDLLQIHCADTLYGGYLENMEEDWTPSAPGFAAGDRKSLDIHMHVMEALTTLSKASGLGVHKRKLKEVMDLILSRMVDPSSGCGRNQFDTAFNPIPAINIRRTWNAERFTGQTVDAPMDSTSYGHNVELSWLLNRAGDVLGMPHDSFAHVTRRLVDHAIRFGLDPEYGGVYRDGPHNGPAVVTDKEWWQNSEVLVGFLDAYQRLGDPVYLEAFLRTWEFDNQYFINHDLGEWRQLVDKTGKILCGDIGNPWKAIYHTGRSMLECSQRLRSILG